MISRKLSTACLAVGLVCSAPASAQVLGFEDVALSPTPTLFNLGSASFAFTFDPALAAAFDPDPYSVRTGGTGETSAFGGFLGIPLEPSVFRTDANILIDNNLFPSFAAFPELTPIPFSLVPGDLALRYTSGADTFFGYARLNGNGTLDFAFERIANTPIVAGAQITGLIPEPSTWAMLLLGFLFVGAAIRASKRASNERPGPLATHA